MDVQRVEGPPPSPEHRPPPRLEPPPPAEAHPPAGAPPDGDSVEISLFGRVLHAVKEFGELNQTALHNAIEEMTQKPVVQTASFKRVLDQRIGDSLEHLSDPGTDRPGVDLIH
jgi:hypothetical protein